MAGAQAQRLPGEGEAVRGAEIQFGELDLRYGPDSIEQPEGLGERVFGISGCLLRLWRWIQWCEARFGAFHQVGPMRG